MHSDVKSLFLSFVHVVEFVWQHISQSLFDEQCSTYFSELLELLELLELDELVVELLLLQKINKKQLSRFLGLGSD